MTFQSKRNVLCEIFDPMQAFFYRFIRPNVEPIKSGYGKAIRKEQENAIMEFVEHYFEKECLTHLKQEAKRGQLKGFYPRFENDYVEDSVLGRGIELDIVAAQREVSPDR